MLKTTSNKLQPSCFYLDFFIANMHYLFMKQLALKNPFGAPVYHEETVSSTFDVARGLALRGGAHGTVISADFQEAGRGRQSRSWKAEKGRNLLFTILLLYREFSSVPAALTLRTGLAVSLAVEELAPALAGKVKVKWPNDVMIGSRKVVGILTESDGNCVFIGVGVNIMQTEFPDDFRSKAGSIVHALQEESSGVNADLVYGINDESRFFLLEKILLHLHEEIEKPQSFWHERLSGRLYKKGEKVTFAEGAANSENLVTGTLSGISDTGELLIIVDGEERAFVNGELRVYCKHPDKLIC